MASFLSVSFEWLVFGGCSSHFYSPLCFGNNTAFINIVKLKMIQLTKYFKGGENAQFVRAKGIPNRDGRAIAS